MKIALIAPGIMPVPPPGWGAVEIIIWDYYNELLAAGNEVIIINKLRREPNDQSHPKTAYCQALITEINNGTYDFVHIHYDVLFHIIPFITTARVIGITSWYPYIDKPEQHNRDGFTVIFNAICKNDNHYIIASSKKDYDMFYKFCNDKSKIFITLNGANHKEIFPYPLDREVINSEKSLYLAKIEERKKQYVYCRIPNIDFYGKCEDAGFASLNCFKGEAQRCNLNDILNSYGNMVLLSSGENGTPLAIKEALMAGLPIVINNNSANDLDLTQPFIDIIPNDKLMDFDFIVDVIKQNLKKRHLCSQIREYAEINFSWKNIMKTYIDKINSIMQ